jgi:hypothetical protein
MNWPRIIKWTVTAAVVMAAVAFVASRISSCLGEPGASTVVVKRDPSEKFEDVHSRTYRPPSIPVIEKKGQSPLPAGIDERQVERVVKLHIAERDTPLLVVQMKTGEILVERDSLISHVEVVDFTPPFVSFELRFGLGLSFGPEPEERWAVRPIASASIMELAGAVRLPVVMIDTRHFGVGCDTRAYHEIWAGAGVFWEYSDLSRRSMRLFIHYTL